MASNNKYKVSTGRGGAGNIQETNSKVSPKLVPQGSQTPSILQPVFSTGRGGAGNMRRNVDPKLTRKAQDVDQEINDDDCIIPSTEDDYIEPLNVDSMERPLSGGISSRETHKEHLKSTRSKGASFDDRPNTVVVGRGGAGNIISPATSRKSQKKKKKASQNKGVWSSLKKLFS